MRKLLGASLALALLVPVTGYAAEATGVVVSWNSGTRDLTIRLGPTPPHTQLTCKFPTTVNVPPTLAANRNVDITYTGPGAGDPGGAPRAGNNCSQIALK